ncbi:hypothetical protein ACJA88_006345 [Fusarium oxysporum]
MAGPPTPVSACPLIYLEIRDGASAKAYNSSHPHNAFTLTIEGERPIGSEMGILVLLIHKGKQQVVRTGDIISINKQTNRICVSVPKKPQALLAQFEEKRDFSVAVCLLQRAGFFASEAIPASLLTVPPQPVSQTHDAMFDIRPRLSSITPPTLLPPNDFQGTGAPPDFSFTTMLNAPLHPSPFSTVPTSHIEQTQRAQSMPIQSYFPGTQMRHTSPVTAQLNPYHMFLERDGTRSHIPRVGSPLRYSFNSSPPPTQSPIGGADMAMPLNVSTTGSDAQSLSVRESSKVGSLECHPDVATESCNTHAGLKKDLSPEPYRRQPLHDQDFRKLMPRPRQLPFDSRAKTAAPYKKPEAHVVQLAVLKTILPVLIRQETSGVEVIPWVMLTDYNTLKDLNQATAPLFEQFEQDIARGGDAALLAQFYSKQLWARRRDFWYKKRQVMVGGE